VTTEAGVPNGARILVLSCRGERAGQAARLAVATKGLQVLWHDAARGAPAWLGRIGLDAIVLDGGFLDMRRHRQFHIWKWWTRWIAGVDCLKIAVPEDEPDHAETLDEWLLQLRVSVVLTAFDEAKRRRLYPLMADRASFRRPVPGPPDAGALAGLERLARPLAERPWDIVYWAPAQPYRTRGLGQRAGRMASTVAARAEQLGLRCQIVSWPEDPLATTRWPLALASARAVLGCEDGSGVLDRRGEMQARLTSILRASPEATHEQMSAQMPLGWDEPEFLTLGPRHVEALLTRTCQVLVEGEYDGVLKAERHYLPLRRDLSNVGEVLARIRDDRYMEELARRAGDIVAAFPD